MIPVTGFVGIIKAAQTIGWRKAPNQLLTLMYTGKLDILRKSYCQLQIGVDLKLTLSLHFMVLSLTRQRVLCFILTQAGSSSNDRALHFDACFNSQQRYEILSLRKNIQKIFQSFQTNSGIAATCLKLLYNLFI
jgi:hypothetical protein